LVDWSIGRLVDWSIGPLVDGVDDGRWLQWYDDRAGYVPLVLVAAQAIDFGNLLIVMALAASIPLLLGLVPRLPVPSSVIEILAGIVFGPAVLGIAESGPVVNVLAKLGVVFLLFLAGLEIDFHVLRGRPVRLAWIAFAASLAIGLLLTLPLGADDVILDPLYITIVLSATSLGIVMPVLKDAGQDKTRTGMYVVAACTAAEFGSIIVLSLFFSSSGSAEPLDTVLKLSVLALAVIVVAFASTRGGRWRQRLDEVLFRLQDSSSQPRVRLVVLLLVALVVLADRLKFDSILGAFLAGAVIAALSDPERDHELGHVRPKLEAIGFGFLVPVFFVATGMTFPVTELFSDSSALLRVPLFLVLLLLVRGLPALVMRDDIDREDLLPAALLQATSLSFIVVAAEVGVRLGEIRPINAASLIAAGMVSVLVFPAGALAILRRRSTVPIPERYEPAGEE
jgi:Kef-type K+ transport system membrane component KefB